MSAALRPVDVTALVPAHEEPPSDELLAELKAQLGSVLVVSDGMPADALLRLHRTAYVRGAEVLELDSRNGKGTAVAAGLDLLLGRASPPRAVLIVDADGQHPPERIPSFLDAGRHAELVIGDRFADLRAMPVLRRAANQIASLAVRLTTGRDVRDTQCGMRLLRGRALEEISFPGGGYEAETVHLKQCLAAGVRVAWVPIPALYGTESSSFRPLLDSAVVLRAALARRSLDLGPRRPRSGCRRHGRKRTRLSGA